MIERRSTRNLDRSLARLSGRIPRGLASARQVQDTRVLTFLMIGMNSRAGRTYPTMVERIDIERALDDLISNEETFRFQGLAIALAQYRWRELVACERHKDHGLDAYASPRSASNGIGKGLSASITPTLKKIRDDAETAKEHYGPFSLLIFATPHKISKEKEHPWAEEILRDFGYELLVMPREDLIALLQKPENAWVCRTHLRIPVPYQSPIGDTLRLVREAALEDAALWSDHARLSSRPLIELAATKVRTDATKARELISIGDLRTWLSQGRKAILQAPAGRGKTTTLIQIAQNPEGTALVMLVDLPAWIQSGLDILEYIAQIRSYRSRGIDAAGLARAFDDEPPQFLLNGWNEVNTLHSDRASLMLRSLVRSYPGAGIIVATRSHHLTPSLPDASRVQLLPLSPDQRLNYLVQAVGSPRGNELDSRLKSDPVLRELTTTPFILAGVTTLVESGQPIPRTRIALIRAIAALAEHSEEHAPYLQSPPLRGHASAYLGALASHSTEQGAVLLAEPEARRICMAVSGQLRAAGQISVSPEPSDILAALTSHHLLDRLDDPNISYRFQHQQFQEFYATLSLGAELTDVAAHNNPERTQEFIAHYINHPTWQEPLCMVAEELDGSASAASQANLLIEGALRVDPLFAAELSRLIAPAARTQATAELARRLRSLYNAPEQQYRQLALAGMLATGSDEFADVLLPLLTHADQQVRLGTYRAGRDFYPSSLGSDWERVVYNWPEELRTEFVSEVALHHRQAEVALTFVRTDSSLKVRLAALRALNWIGMSQETIPFFSAMSDDEFATALANLHVEEIPSALVARAVATYKGLLAKTDDSRQRIKITLALAELRDPDTPSRLKAELDKLPSEVVKELSDYSLRPALEGVRQLDAEWVSSWVASHIIDGTLWPDHWLPYVSGIDPSSLDELLRRICTEDLRLSRSAGVIAIVRAVASADTARTLFNELKGRHETVFTGRANDTERTIYNQIERLLGSLPAGVIIDGLSEILWQPVQPEELRIITDLFRWSGSSGRPELRSSISPAQRQKLRSYFLSCVPVVLAQDDFRGEVKGYLSTALVEVGEPADAGQLMDMVRADITRVREGRAAQARGERSARANGSPACWSGWYVQALVRLLYLESEPFLLELLNEPEYEVDAAWGLVLIARNEMPGPNALSVARLGNVQRDYRTLGSLPATDWSAAFDSERRERYASAVRNRIDALFSARKGTGSADAPIDFRLKELGAVLATLAPTESAERILGIAALNSRFDGWRRLRLLESLVFAGLRLPTDRTIEILEPVVEQVRRYGINNEGHLLVRLFCLLPFTDVPERGIARLRDLLGEFRVAPFNERNLLMALARCGDQAGLDFLHQLAIDNTPIFQHSAKEWIEAVSACELPGASTIVLSFIDPALRHHDHELTISEHALNTVASRIVDLARSQPSVAQRISELCAQTTSEQQRLILCSVVAWLASEDVLLAGLDLISDTSRNPLPYELRKGIEGLVLEKQPYRSSQSYTLAPRAADRVKKRLFQMLRDPQRSRTASHLIAQIEEWRLEYGRPASEPRHPAFDSAECWPPGVTI